MRLLAAGTDDRLLPLGARVQHVRRLKKRTPPRVVPNTCGRAFQKARAVADREIGIIGHAARLHIEVS